MQHAAASAAAAAPAHLQPQPGSADAAGSAAHCPLACPGQLRQRWKLAAVGKPREVGSSTKAPADPTNVIRSIGLQQQHGTPEHVCEITSGH